MIRPALSIALFAYLTAEGLLARMALSLHDLWPLLVVAFTTPLLLFCLWLFAELHHPGITSRVRVRLSRRPRP